MTTVINVNGLTTTVADGSDILISGNDDSVDTSNSTVTLVDNITADVDGSGNQITLGSGDKLFCIVPPRSTADTVTVVGTGDSIVTSSPGLQITVTGAGSSTSVDAAMEEGTQVTLAADNQTLTLGGLFNSATANGQNDTVILVGNQSFVSNAGANGISVILNVDGKTEVVEGDNNVVQVFGNNDEIDISGNSQVVEHGAGEFIDAPGPGLVASFATGAEGSALANDATVTVGDNAQVNINGENNNVVMGSGGILELTDPEFRGNVNTLNTVTTQGTNDTIIADHPTTISLAGSATITGSLDTVTMAGDDQSLTVMGSNDSISTTGTDDTVTLFGSANALTTSAATSIVLSGPDGTATVNGTGDSLALSGTGESVTYNGGDNSATITGDADSVQSVGGTVAVTMGLSGSGQITVNNSLITTNDNSETSVIGNNDQVATSAASGGFTTLNLNGVGDSATVTDFGFTTSEQMVLANGPSGGTSPVNDLFLGTGVGDLDHRDIWLQASGNDLLIERLGSNDSVTVSNWFAGAGNQLSAIHAGDGTELLNAQVAQLVQGMAAFQAANPGFDPTAAGASQVAQNDAGLQNTIAAAWHS